MRTRTVLTIMVGIVVALPAHVAAEASSHRVEKPGKESTEWREVFSPDGSIRRVKVTVPADKSPAPRSRVVTAEVIPVEVNGPSGDRLDLVFVGDGYTSSQFDTYSRHVRSKFNEIMTTEPFRSHREQFNVWQVNVASRESGVDNDPSRGIDRETALDMGFWCSGMERLLCVNQTKAQQYAEQARDVDQVVALANSTKYGGAGGDVATASGGNSQSGQIAIHEMGHSIGGLADEYSYGRGDCYSGQEPREINVSTYRSGPMRQQQVKWYRWLGQATPDGGVIGTYEGAYYHRRCIYRPSRNSIMRTLGQEFNLPSREAMIAAFYRNTGLIDASTSTKALSTTTQLQVRPIAATNTVTTTWRVDGRRVGQGDQLDLASLSLSDGRHVITATVTDRTPWVRDPELRRTALTDTRTWTLVT